MQYIIISKIKTLALRNVSILFVGHPQGVVYINTYIKLDYKYIS
jgi:hypothetical protein